VYDYLKINTGNYMDAFFSIVSDNVITVIVVCVVGYVIAQLNSIITLLKSIRRIYANSNKIDIGED